MELKTRFKTQYPDKFFLDKEDRQSLESYLLKLNLLHKDESIIKAERPGAGNMNYVLRVITPSKTLVLKQSRPWVEKFPSLSAPVERIAVEATYYRLMQHLPALQAYTPNCIKYDGDNYLLVLEDLGDSIDYTFLYKKENFVNQHEIQALMQYISTLHNWEVSEYESHFPANIGMRELNHEHIFFLPYEKNNGFDLDAIQEGLQDLAIPYIYDKTLKELIHALGQVYLSHGDSLLHGDYYPGSWLRVENELKVIDAEFSFMGRAEFDLGVLFAHMYLTQHKPTTLQAMWDLYQPPETFDKELLAGFTGTEIMRRLIGLAQLPVVLSLEEKEALLAKAASWIKSGTLDDINLG